MAMLILLLLKTCTSALNLVSGQFSISTTVTNTNDHRLVTTTSQPNSLNRYIIAPVQIPYGLTKFKIVNAFFSGTSLNFYFQTSNSSVTLRFSYLLFQITQFQFHVASNNRVLANSPTCQNFPVFSRPYSKTSFLTSFEIDSFLCNYNYSSSVNFFGSFFGTNCFYYSLNDCGLISIEFRVFIIETIALHSNSIAIVLRTAAFSFTSGNNFTTAPLYTCMATACHQVYGIAGFRLVNYGQLGFSLQINNTDRRLTYTDLSGLRIRTVQYALVAIAAVQNPISCIPGMFYDASDGICTNCVSNCAVCNNNLECVCPDTRYLSQSPSTCAFCITLCRYCLNNNVCSICVANAVLSVTQQCTCSTSSFQSQPYVCTACTALCATCTAVGACVSCVPNSTMQSNSLCSCVNGYFSSNLVCAACSSNCLTCVTSVNSCLCTVLGHYIQAPSTCRSCPTKCLICTSSQNCLSCRNNLIYFPADNLCKCNVKTYQSSIHCYPCIPECWLCTDSNSCFCLIHFNFVDNFTCKPCPPNCLSCSSTTSCDTCIQNSVYDSKGNLCKCSAQFYFSQGPTCLPCQPQCYICSATDCSCSKVGNYLSFEGQCVACLASCVKCVTFDRCEKCAAGMEYLSETTECGCSPGYFRHFEGCTACSQFCQTCNLVQFCLSCASGYFLFNRICFSNCPPNSIFNSATLTCLCLRYFVLVGQACVLNFSPKESQAQKIQYKRKIEDLIQTSKITSNYVALLLMLGASKMLGPLIEALVILKISLLANCPKHPYLLLYLTYFESLLRIDLLLQLQKSWNGYLESKFGTSTAAVSKSQLSFYFEHNVLFCTNFLFSFVELACNFTAAFLLVLLRTLTRARDSNFFRNRLKAEIANSSVEFMTGMRSQHFLLVMMQLLSFSANLFFKINVGLALSLGCSHVLLVCFRISKIASLDLLTAVFYLGYELRTIMFPAMFSLSNNLVMQLAPCLVYLAFLMMLCLKAWNQLKLIFKLRFISQVCAVSSLHLTLVFRLFDNLGVNLLVMTLMTVYLIVTLRSTQHLYKQAYKLALKLWSLISGRKPVPVGDENKYYSEKPYQSNKQSSQRRDDRVRCHRLIKVDRVRKLCVIKQVCKQ